MTALEVLERHKDIFKDYFEGGMNCMSWGLDVPDDWVPIIDELCGAWKGFGWVRGKTKKPLLVATQVKEKFGGLRFYYRMEQDPEGDPSDFEWYENVFDGMVSYAEHRIECLEKEKKERGGLPEWINGSAC